MNVQVDPNEDTEFHDALRARGIIPPKPPSRSPSPELPTQAESRAAHLSTATPSQLASEVSKLESRAGPSAEAEERLLDSLRRQRLAALESHRRRTDRFGRVYPISRPDYTREVTEASKEEVAGSNDDDEEEEDEVEIQTGAGEVKGPKSAKEKRKGTGVVCFLYKDGIETCKLLAGHLDQLAAKYPSSKFVSIVGDKCIPNYPDRNLPTMLVYRAGELHRQIVGLRPEIGLPGMKTTLADVEFVLTAVGAIDPSEARRSGSSSGGLNATSGRADESASESDGEDSDEGFGGNRRGSAARGVNAPSSGAGSGSGRKGFVGGGLGNRVEKGDRKASVLTQEEEDDLDWD